MLNNHIQRGILRSTDEGAAAVADEPIETPETPETPEPEEPRITDSEFEALARERGFERRSPSADGAAPSPNPPPDPWQEATQRVVARYGWADPNAIAYEATSIQNQRLHADVEQRMARFEDAQMQPVLEQEFEQRGWPREAARSFSAARRAVGALSANPEEQSLLASALSIGLHVIKSGATAGRRPQNPEADLGAPATGASGLGLKGAEAGQFENWRRTWYGEKSATRAMVKEFRSL
jgi:hypothetical protein